MAKEKSLQNKVLSQIVFLNSIKSVNVAFKETIELINQLNEENLNNVSDLERLNSIILQLEQENERLKKQHLKN